MSEKVDEKYINEIKEITNHFKESLEKRKKLIASRNNLNDGIVSNESCIRQVKVDIDFTAETIEDYIKELKDIVTKKLDFLIGGLKVEDIREKHFNLYIRREESENTKKIYDVITDYTPVFKSIDYPNCDAEIHGLITEGEENFIVQVRVKPRAVNRVYDTVIIEKDMYSDLGIFILNGCLDYRLLLNIDASYIKGKTFYLDINKELNGILEHIVVNYDMSAEKTIWLENYVFVCDITVCGEQLTTRSKAIGEYLWVNVLE